MGAAWRLAVGGALSEAHVLAPGHPMLPSWASVGFKSPSFGGRLLDPALSLPAWGYLWPCACLVAPRPRAGVCACPAVTAAVSTAGLPEQYYSLTWFLSPILGLVFTPIIGSASDRCTLSWGRRRPFILALCVGVLFGVALFLNGSAIGECPYAPRVLAGALLPARVWRRGGQPGRPWAGVGLPGAPGRAGAGPHVGTPWEPVHREALPVVTRLFSMRI